MSTVIWVIIILVIIILLGWFLMSKKKGDSGPEGPEEQPFDQGGQPGQQ